MHIIRNCFLNRSLLRLPTRFTSAGVDGTSSYNAKLCERLCAYQLQCRGFGRQNIISYRQLHDSRRLCVLKDGEQIDNITDEEWRQKLSDQQYYVCRQHGTEMPFTGDLLHNKKMGFYSCVCCQSKLFSSTAKFDSGSGWPSFFKAINEENLIHRVDKSNGMTRIEVLCRKCNSHLGHVFADGPEPTGQRYCINSVSLDFTETKL